MNRFDGPALICTGNKAPIWLQESGLKVNSAGRILTNSCLTAIGTPNVFAVGDCGVIRTDFRPPSGVWAVKAALPLARNIERSFAGKRLINWQPQYFAMLLVGRCNPAKIKEAWLIWGPLMIGPHHFLWKLKKHIDIKFMNDFKRACIESFN